MRIIFLIDFERFSQLKMVAFGNLNAWVRVVYEGRGRLE